MAQQTGTNDSRSFANQARDRGGVVVVDGATGEGGGQILRTSLALSLLTGRPLVIENIRAGRDKPGLLRQHLTCVRAAAEVGNAVVEGAELGSSRLRFRPGPIVAGEFRFRVGSAGSTLLILHALTPALLRANGASVVVVEGGTHAKAAPAFEHFANVFLPMLSRLGVSASIEIERHGFYPAGGGRVVFRVDAASLRSASFLERGRLESVTAQVLYARLDQRVARRGQHELHKRLAAGRDSVELREVESVGPGLALVVESRYAHASTAFAAFGEKGVRVEKLVAQVTEQHRRYLDHDAPVDEHLADQLVLPMALAGGGEARIAGVTPHLRTQVHVLAHFGGRARLLEGTGRTALLVVEPLA